VQHEHQTIPGVVEDIHQIIQSLKRLVIILDADVEEAKLELSVTKAGVVEASAITDSAGVAIVNPELQLFTLQDDLPAKRPLTLHFWVNRGRGFVAAEQHEKPEDVPVDLIRIDSIYNPVLRANFFVQETRVGQRTDFDRLTIQVETDGSLDPADALASAAEIGQAHLGYLVQVGSGGNGGQPSGIDGAGAAGGLRTVSEDLLATLETPLEAFDQISIRSRNNLDKADIRTVLDVVRKTRDEILGVASFGEKSLQEVAEVLALNGLRFGMRVERGEDDTLYIVDDTEAEGGDEA